MSLGYDHESFWDQTPATVQLTFDAYNLRLEREYNERAWLAWHIAALPKVKRFPPLSKMMINGKAKAAPTEKQLENLRRWVQATGGKVIVRPRDE